LVLNIKLTPSAGGYISQYTSWRWCFFAIVFANITVQIIGFFFLQETYAPRILGDKARDLRTQTGNPMLRTEWEQADQNRTFPRLVAKALRRPWIMIGTQPIIQVLAVYQAFNFGTLYLLISGFPALWEERYGMPRGDASLNYLSIAIGSLIGVGICGPATDAVYAALKRRRGIPDDEPGLPEFRMPLVVPVSILSPCAIILYGWAAQEKMHWVVPNVSDFAPVCFATVTDMFADRGRNFRWELHHLLPMHLGVPGGCVQLALSVRIVGVRFPAFDPRICLPAVRSRPVRESRVRARRELDRRFVVCARGPGPVDYLAFWPSVTRSQPVYRCPYSQTGNEVGNEIGNCVSKSLGLGMSLVCWLAALLGTHLLGVVKQAVCELDWIPEFRLDFPSVRLSTYIK